MSAVPVFDLGEGDIVAINPALVRFVRAYSGGVVVIFDVEQKIFVPDTTVEAMALALWGASLGPARDGN